MHHRHGGTKRSNQTSSSSTRRSSRTTISSRFTQLRDKRQSASLSTMVLTSAIAILMIFGVLLPTLWMTNKDTSSGHKASSMLIDRSFRMKQKREQSDKDKRRRDRNRDLDQQRQQQHRQNRETKRQNYEYWKEFAVKLAALPPAQVLDILRNQDPFGVRRFEAALMQQESIRQRRLNLTDIQALFPCPDSNRISLPDQRNHQKAHDFKRGDNFLFFQHLRKAGGTNFCTLAQRNLPKAAVPSYYCMIDYQLSNWTCAGCLHRYDNDIIVRQIKQSGHRIAGNEWDNFDVEHHFELPAVFCTSFRRPLDRALSQFRFECMENRGCHTKNIAQWWEKRRDLYNVYTCTFSDVSRPRRWKDIFEDPHKNAKRSDILGIALDTVAKFHLVLVMEWLVYAGPLVEDVLGFHDLSALSHRVRPHIGQAQRNDGAEQNELGAVGIANASWVGEKYLDSRQYRVMSEHLALDEILTDAARRMFLERLVCGDKI